LLQKHDYGWTTKITVVDIEEEEDSNDDYLNVQESVNCLVGSSLYLYFMQKIGLMYIVMSHNLYEELKYITLFAGMIV
jgi:hypothetical protein